MEKITICMGSSCYARGNGEHLILIESYLEARGLGAAVELRGCRCRGQCGFGPVIEIGGVLHHELDAGTVMDLLEHHFKPVEEGR
jgi:NADH:ubiquinone oxidoreductase subunit E